MKGVRLKMGFRRLANFQLMVRDDLPPYLDPARLI